MRFVEVTLGDRRLKLSPLDENLTVCFGKAVIALEVARQRDDDSWRRALQNVGNFVYLAAKRNHPDLELANVIDLPRAEPLLAAMVALSEMIRECRREREIQHGL